VPRGRRWLVALLPAIVPAATVAPQNPPTTGLFSAPVSPRFSGLGSATVAMIGYAGSIFTNPAGLASVRNMSLEGAYAGLTDTSSYFMGAAAVRLGPLNLGGGLRYLRFDDGLATQDNLESVFGAVARVKGVALGLAGDWFAVEDSAGIVTRTLTTDAALTVAFFDIAALALVAQNIGRAGLGTGGFDLPSSIHLGFSLNLIDTYSNGRLLATIEQTWSEGSAETLLGLEGGAVFSGVGLVARVGSGRTPGSPFKRFAWGGSVVLGRSALDYAYLERPGAGPLHVFGMRLTL